jgi:hypothetical protein
MFVFVVGTPVVSVGAYSLANIRAVAVVGRP